MTRGPATSIVRLAVVACFTALLTGTAVHAAAGQEPGRGYRVTLPPGWQAVSSGAGHIVFASQNPLEYAYVRPILQRTSNCATTLRQTLTSRQAGGAVLSDVRIEQTGPREAVARFLISGGAGRGAVLCAETSPRVGMLYGAVVPAGAFAREWPTVMAVLGSFSYQPTARAGAAAGGESNATLPLLTSWREPHERAFTLDVPVGWRMFGGIQRQDVTHYTSGVQATDPAGSSGVRIGDTRVGQCTVPGPGMNGMSGQGSMRFCRMSTAAQVAATYLNSVLAADLGLSAIQPVVTEREDLARRAEQATASMGARIHSSVVEVRFTARRGGAPVSGAIMVRNTLYPAVQGQSFLVGTLSSDITGFWGPPERFGTLARLTGVMLASMHVDPVWWAQTQQINADIARRTLDQLHAEAQNAQQASWDRMAAADRRSESVGYLLSGTSRLSDGSGKTYEAKAGSNYYFLDGGNRVIRTDTWPSSTVDLQQLMVIR